MRYVVLLLAAAALATAPKAAVPQAPATLAAASGPVLSSAPEEGGSALESMIARQKGESPHGAAPAPAPVEPPLPEAARSEGQDHADYVAWLDRNPQERVEVEAFQAYLASAGVANVVAEWEVLRTASMWRDCSGPSFEVAPRAAWPHIAASLRYIRDEVVPAIGRVHAVSGYRNEGLNRCAHGAPASAHRHFYALDLVPARALGRQQLVRSMCAAHTARGRSYNVGLGFYSGTRFHIDSKSYRRWGPDGSGATSPCVTEV